MLNKQPYLILNSLTLFRKNFVKATVLLIKKLLNNAVDLTNFFSVRKNFSFFHLVHCFHFEEKFREINIHLNCCECVVLTEFFLKHRNVTNRTISFDFNLTKIT